MFMFPLNVHTVRAMPHFFGGLFVALADLFRETRAMERDAYRRGLLANR